MLSIATCSQPQTSRACFCSHAAPPAACSGNRACGALSGWQAKPFIREASVCMASPGPAMAGLSAVRGADKLVNVRATKRSPGSWNTHCQVPIRHVAHEVVFGRDGAKDDCLEAPVGRGSHTLRRKTAQQGLCPPPASSPPSFYVRCSPLAWCRRRAALRALSSRRCRPPPSSARWCLTRVAADPLSTEAAMRQPSSWLAPIYGWVGPSAGHSVWCRRPATTAGFSSSSDRGVYLPSRTV